MSQLVLSLGELEGQPLGLVAREGAKLVLTVALEQEVTEFLQCQMMPEMKQGSYYLAMPGKFQRPAESCQNILRNASPSKPVFGRQVKLSMDIMD